MGTIAISEGLLINGAVLAVSIAVAWYDIRLGIIPDPVVAALALVALWRAGSIGPDEILQRALDAALVLAFLLLLRHAYKRMRGRTGLGLGDVKLASAATALVGLSGAHVMLLVACISAVLFAGVTHLLHKQVTATTVIRFGPHLALGLVVAQWTASWDTLTSPF